MLMNERARVACWTAWASFAIAAIGCSGGAPTGSGAAEEAVIRRADDAWIQAIAAKQLDTTVSFYDENGSLFVPNAPIATGREQIRKVWATLFGVPGFSLVPTTTKLEVARSGDLAYSQGSYQFTVNNAQGSPVTDRGKFVIVWKKQPDGSWKAAADIFNSDLPVASAR